MKTKKRIAQLQQKQAEFGKWMNQRSSEAKVDTRKNSGGYKCPGSLKCH